VGKYQVGLPLGYQTWPGKYLKVDDVPVDRDLQLASTTCNFLVFRAVHENHQKLSANSQLLAPLSSDFGKSLKSNGFLQVQTNEYSRQSQASQKL
jgi:hypothetical protein